MKKLLILSICVLFSASIFAQIKFLPGYFVDNNGKKTECLIRDVDWRDNPTSFDYKMTPEGEVQKRSIEETSSFLVDDGKYERHTVDIDMSTDIVSQMKDNPKPEYKTQQVLLRVLVEGDATLYYYEYQGIMRFFFSKNESTPEPLIYKRFITKDEKGYKQISRNTAYKQQIFNYLACETIKRRDTDIKYSRDEMIDFFVKYNKCKGGTYTEVAERKFSVVHLHLRPGVKWSSLSVDNGLYDSRDTDFGSQIGGRIGLEVEMVLPYFNDSWAAFVEPTFQYFSKESQTPNGESANFTYNSMSIPLGVRYAYFLNDDTSIQLKAAYSFDIPFSSSVTFTNDLNAMELDINTRNNYVFGLGVRHKRLGAEVRYQTARALMGGYVYWDAPYQQSSLILSYQLF